MNIEKDHLLKIRKIIKEFEHEHLKRYHRKPTTEEVRQQPQISKYYKIYFKFKHLLLLDGDGEWPTINPTITSVPVAEAAETTTVSHRHSKEPVTNGNSNIGHIDNGGNRSMQGVWNRRLNKPPKDIERKRQLNVVSGSKTEDTAVGKDRIDFQPILQKIKQLNEQNYAEELKRTKNKSYHYSLKFRKRYLEKKSEEIASVRPPESSHAEDGSASFFFDQIINPKSNGDNEFYLDDLNETIKHSILESDFIHVHGPEKAAEETDGGGRKRPVFGLPEEMQGIEYPPHKRFKSRDDYDDGDDDGGDGNSKKEKKFFKSRQNNPVADDFNVKYDVSLFFDHTRELDFEPTETDHSLLAKATKKKKKPANCLNDITNQSSKQTAAAKPATKFKQQDNFRRLHLKKKMFARGHKRFNMKRYKFKKYYANRKTARFTGGQSKCSKCASSDHIDDECTNIPSLAIYEDGDEYDCQRANQPQPQYRQPKINFDDPDDPELERLVTNSLADFGLKEFRQNQKQVVKRILCGQSTLLVAPTGSGKSLCYQLAAYCFWKLNNYITVVISPLISLMQDQLHNFPKCLKGVCYNSSQDEAEKKRAIDAIIENRAQVLFLSPECLVNGLRSIMGSCFPTVAFVCIDEAHCMAEWSNNFRPSYLHLYKVLKSKLNINTFLAMTATATKEVATVICRNLSFNPGQDVIGHTKVPENLVLTVSKSGPNKLSSLIELLRKEPFKTLRSIIVYCTRREETERVATYIRTSLQFDVQDASNLAQAYHAGLSAQLRKSIQRHFVGGKLRIVVATLAFGMGINKKDVRGIIHYNMPKSFENYLQEIGRAGRDGQESYCHLFLDANGEELFALQSYIYANGADKCNLRKFVRQIYQPCKCRTIAEELGDQDQNRCCSGHPVALPIFTTEVETDIKSEILHTLLMCLEMTPPAEQFAIRLDAPFNSNCQIVNFGDDDDMDRLIRNDAILKMANVLVKRQWRNNSNNNNANNFKFSLVDVARLIGRDVMEIRHHLRQLEWDREKNRRRTNIAVRFADYSFFVHAPGTLTGEQIETVVDHLYRMAENYERKEIAKLRFVYAKFNEFVTADADHRGTSDRIKQFINGYFTNDNLEPIEPPSPLPYEMTEEEIASATYTIASLVQTHYEQGVNTPRKMARILQGISSPQFPAETWGRVKKFWRALPRIDFRQLMQLCRESLINSHHMQSS